MEENQNIEIGLRIKNIRVSLGLTMDEFGKKFIPTIPKSTISKWENGKYKPNNARIKRIAELGGVSVDYLLNGYTDLQGNQMPVSDLAHYQYKILSSIRRRAKTGNTFFFYTAIKLYTDSNSKLTIVRTTCVTKGGDFFEFYIESNEKRIDDNDFHTIDSDFYNKLGIKADAIDNNTLNLNEYIKARCSVTDNGELTKFRKKICLDIFAKIEMELENISKCVSNERRIFFIDENNHIRRIE